MEYYWTLFNNSNANSTTNTVRGQNGNFTPNHAWDSWDLPTTSAAAAAASRSDWTYYTTQAEPTSFHPPMMQSGAAHSCSSTITSSSSLYGNPDPHLTCLKLGKRHYFEDLTPPPPLGPISITKKGKSCVNAPEPPPGVVDSAAVALPRCQVEGCEAVLLNAKDYHRRHKVCEMHAKAPKVVVLGIEQRFCQQCSRFHALVEFDEAKRSCRRRLAGHNERRRKSSQEQNSLSRKHYHGGQPHLLKNSECALSLLSPTNYHPWNSGSATSSPDLPARCSAALRELIAENRASLFACRQLINPNQMGNYKLGSGWAASAAPENRGHVTLNLMQGPDSAFGLLSGHNHRSSEEDGDGDCSELWKLPLGY